MNYELKNLDFWDNEIKKLSSKYLKSILKLCKKQQIKNMIQKELEHRKI